MRRWASEERVLEELERLNDASMDQAREFKGVVSETHPWFTYSIGGSIITVGLKSDPAKVRRYKLVPVEQE